MNKQKGSALVIILIIVGLVVVIVGGYFGYQYFSSQKNNNQQQTPSIIVTSPNGGETWKIGQTYVISTTSKGDLGTRTVRLNRYSDDGVRVGAETIGSTNTDTFSYTIPIGTEETRQEANRYKIQVLVDKYSDGMGVADESDNYFSIVAPVVDQTAGWLTYTNIRVGYKFSYPSTDLTLSLSETIKYPSVREGDSKTEDFVQFAVSGTVFGIKTFVGEGKSTIESWIQEPNTSRAYYDLSKYEKIIVDGKTAYRTKGNGFIYVLANKNVYQIAAYSHQSPAPIKISEEPLFEKWVATIEFTK